jgi:hypothetical protein
LIKHFQNQFGSEGNCWQAAVASVLDLPLEAVPHFVKISDDGGQHWWLHTLDFLSDYGYTLEVIREHLDTDEYYFVSGPSPRGQELHHVVIYKNGRMVHDPHPDGTGVLEEKHFEVIRKKD